MWAKKVPARPYRWEDSVSKADIILVATKVFISDYEDPKTWEYFDKVGLMHSESLNFR